MADLDLHLVRCFTAVAEHGTFGRAAATLHVAQPALSRQIQRLEQQVGVRLLERTSQGSRLTDAGRVFLPQAQALLRTADRAVVTAREAAPPHRITIGYAFGFIVTPVVQTLRQHFPQAQVHTRSLDWNEGRFALPDHRVDAVVARWPLPIEPDGLRMTVLYDEPRVLVVPTVHRLAGREAVTADDFADEPRVHFAGASAVFNAFWRLEPRSTGRPAPDGPVVETFDDKLEVVAAGDAVALLPAGDQRSTLRPDLTTIPVEGIEPCQVVVFTRANDHNPLVAAFCRLARTHFKGARRPDRAPSARAVRPGTDPPNGHNSPASTDGSSSPTTDPPLSQTLSTIDIQPARHTCNKVRTPRR